MKRKGFTLIELLVVIAIIGILAAMLFPVFARARESARKIQCLANIKNIAIAYQMYLTDYDCFMPKEHRAEVRDWYNDFGGTDGCCCYIEFQNPYLQPPVILDEYIKNRDVWSCPSARFVHSWTMNPGFGGDWFAYRLQFPDLFGCPPNGCNDALPMGWGGTITDTFVQGECASGDTGGFRQSIGYPRTNQGLKTSQINDPAKRVVCADAGYDLSFYRTSRFAYPDRYGVEKALCGYPVADWVNCDQSLDCGAGDPRFQTDTQYRKEHSWPRHLGGSNIGFADGHAAWMPSEKILFVGEPESPYVQPTEVLLEGVYVCGWGPAE